MSIRALTFTNFYSQFFTTVETLSPREHLEYSDTARVIYAHIVERRNKIVRCETLYSVLDTLESNGVGIRYCTDLNAYLLDFPNLVGIMIKVRRNCCIKISSIPKYND